MATISASSKETTNYARLCRLLVDVGSQVLRDVFEKLRPPGSLDTVLKTPSVSSTLTSLKKKRVLNHVQWTKLTSSSVASVDFDITLIAVLLRNICGLSAPATGWNTPPSASDKTEAADITRIKIYRNEVYAHVNRASVDEAQFNAHWMNIKDPLVRLGGIKYEAIIDNLKTEGIDPEKEKVYQQLLKEWTEYEESVTEELGEIKEQLGTLNCKILASILASLRTNQNPPKDDQTETPFLEDLLSDDKKLSKLSLECFITTPTQFKGEVYPSLLKSLTGVLIIPDTLLPHVANGHFVKSEVLPESVLFDFQRRPSPKDCDHISSIMDDLNAIIVSSTGETKASDFVRRQGKTDILASLLLKRLEDKIYLYFSQIANVDVGTLRELAMPAPATFSHTRSNHKDVEVGDRVAEMDWQTRQHCFSLAKKIDIEDLEGDVIHIISNVLPLLSRPREIVLRSLKESSISQETGRVVSGINMTECLRRLKLHKTCLTEKSLPVLANALQKACNLQELVLSENPLGSSVRCLAANLRHVQQLTILELSDVLMEHEAFSDLADSLRHVPNLEVLSVSRNQLGTSILDLADNLKFVPRLTRLELGETHMDENGGRALSDCLQSLPRLQVLDISHNPLGSAVVVIADNLCKATSLTDLNMTDTKMGAEEATALGSSLMSLQNLTTLSIGSNQLAQGVSALVWRLSEKSKLKRLNMENVEMGEEEVENVAKTCKKIQSLAIVNDYLVSNLCFIL